MNRSLKNKSRLGLDIALAAEKGIQYAISQHDSSSSIPYVKKLEFLKKQGDTDGDDIKERVKEFHLEQVKGDVKEQLKTHFPSAGGASIDNSPKFVGTLETTDIKGKSMKQTVDKFVNTNKEAVIDTAYLALGKLVVDTAAAKLPKEVGLLGPLAVAEVVQLIPINNVHSDRMKHAALTYAMFVTYQKTDIAKFIEDLSGMAEEVEL
tara:strand:- start:802 stop:1422 length:621 start_codon:yes stop_codon:yes gene_type:complete